MRQAAAGLVLCSILLSAGCTKKRSWDNPLDPANNLPPIIDYYLPQDGFHGVDPSHCYCCIFYTDPNLGDSVMACDVFLGTANPPPYQRQADYNNNGGDPIYEFTTDALTPSTNYFWRVSLTDNHGAVTLSPVWSFRTGSK